MTVKHLGYTVCQIGVTKKNVMLIYQTRNNEAHNNFTVRYHGDQGYDDMTTVVNSYHKGYNSLTMPY